MLRTRREILSVLRTSQEETKIKLLATGPQHSSRITIESTRQKDDEPVTLKAALLIRSSDWYRYRLNVFGKLAGIESIVCAIHDSCVDIQVWCVEDAKAYEPGETVIPLTSLRDPKVRGTKYGSLLFTAALLCSKQEALDILNDDSFPISTRYRYEAKVRYYANLKRGTKLSLA
ncbi:hypothetical protein KDW_30520 [Dictyobacter vulcani]|uniref:Uncharacterized protein n=1 Tax=Dictyobacter vulcani TaxID=2607529 RepID=A0A5J4KR22_9CHLR|nr:hypothetical protein [Dictyobacter vulcani]GER88890.1 hypothetical protein KDW_30520 [Dictyobacter vulcani]